MSKRYIYGLIDPRNGRVRYVGCTWNKNKRLSDHLRGARADGTPKERWLAELASLDLSPKYEILSTVDWRRSAAEEQRLIAELGAQYDLTNSSMGGEGLETPHERYGEMMRDPEGPVRYDVVLQCKVTSNLRDEFIEMAAQEGLKYGEYLRNVIRDFVWARRNKAIHEEDGRLGA